MSFSNKYDPLESLIFEKGLTIIGLHFYHQLDLMLVVLNNRKVIEYPLSNSTKLAHATDKELAQYEFIGRGAGIHWPDLDEDISLKGLLHYAFNQAYA